MKSVCVLMTTWLVCVAAEAVVTISDVKAKQRFPWNGLVDVTYAVNGATGDYKVKLSAYDTIGKSNLPVRVVWTPGGSMTNNPVQVAATRTHVIWNAAADLPSGFVAEGVAITAQAYVEPEKTDGLYCVIDLSGGMAASHYNVSYLDDVPEGGWTDEYKTTKLVLRKITPNTFMMGCRSTDYTYRQYQNDYYISYPPTPADVDFHQVTLSGVYYFGVFPVTQRQYELVTGWNPSTFTSDTSPVDCVSFNGIRGQEWPNSKQSDESTFIGVLRSKTGFDFDLPTDAQWEYACRAGTGTALNNGKNTTHYFGNYYTYYNPQYDDPDYGSFYDPMAHVMCGFWETKGGTTGTCAVGSYEPNKWGLYDCHGNVWEWCLDWYSELGTAAATDPVGPTTGTKRVLRGGCYKSYLYECRSGYRGASADPSTAAAGYGFRIVRRLP